MTYKALLFIPGAALPSTTTPRSTKRACSSIPAACSSWTSAPICCRSYFRFVRGVVDSPDLSLNISRELLQHDRQLKVIAANLEKKIKSELEQDAARTSGRAMRTSGRTSAARSSTASLHNYGAHKELLQDLLLFYSSTEKKLVTLDEYVSRMKEDQKFIYYAAGETRRQDRQAAPDWKP